MLWEVTLSDPYKPIADNRSPVILLVHEIFPQIINKHCQNINQSSVFSEQR